MVKMNNVPKIFECIEQNGRLGFVMEKVQGKSLASLMMDEQNFEYAMRIFIENDCKLALKYGNDISFLKRNNAEFS